jgi:NAD(P)H-dependent FMN reductase
MIKVLGLCGSLRADSFNLKLLKNFLGALDAGRYATSIHGSVEMPLINQDIEHLPLDPRILALQKAVSEAQVVVLASPEYNASIGGPLKNAIDWGTRPPPTNVWQGKIVVLLSASPGALGGARGLIALRTVVAGLKAWVIPEQVQCSAAHEAFDANGALRAEPVRKQIAAAVQGLDTFAKKWLP